MIRSNLIKIIGFCLILTSPSFASLQAKQDMIELQADNVTYDYKKGIINYEGHVVAVQGTTQLLADQITVSHNQKHKIEKVIAIGKLARYKTLLNDNKDTLIASAKKIYYYPLAGKVVLEEMATVEYNKNIFTGPYIYYDINNKVISSHPNKPSRSKIILEPFTQLKNIKTQ